MLRAPHTMKHRVRNTIITPVFKQGFFTSQTRLLYTSNKASLRRKEALFANVVKCARFPGTIHPSRNRPRNAIQKPSAHNADSLMKRRILLNLNKKTAKLYYVVGIYS